MRIIAGIAKGRKLISPPGLFVRPTPAKVRGAIFDILGTRVMEARVLDLFCGSGAMGIEALSRGASTVVFVDNHRSSLACVRKNLETVKLADRARVLRRQLPSQLNGSLGSNFTIIISDPPYDTTPVADLATILGATKLTADGACWVHESASRGAGIDEKDVPSWFVESTRRYGDTAVTILEKIVRSQPAS